MKHNIAMMLRLLHNILYFFAIGLIFNCCGYAPEYLRLLFLYSTWLISICCLQHLDQKKPLLFLLLVGILVSWLDLHEVIIITVLLIAHLYLWCEINPRFAAYEAPVALYFILHVIIFFLPSGYYFADYLGRLFSSLSTFITGSSVNVGYSYYNVGSLILFSLISIILKLRRHRLVKSLSFITTLIVVSAFCLNYLLRYIGIEGEIMWEFKYQEYVSLGSFWGYLKNLVPLYIPLFMYLLHMTIFLIMNIHGDLSSDND